MSPRVAVVTGSAQGIGRKYASGLAADGLTVVVADIKADAARTAAEEIVAEGGHAVSAAVDVSDPASAGELARFVRERFGRLDVLVNNAALFEGTHITTPMKVDLDYWRKIFRVNLDGVLIMVQALAPLMLDGGWGRIVNQASTAAYSGTGDPYGVSKAALINLTVGMSNELAPKGVTVNAIAPGPIPTEAMKGVVPAERLSQIAKASPVGRLGAFQDLLHGLRYLIAEDASWITGQTLVIDGGWVKRF